MSALLNSFQGPWICLGDFNFITNEKESSNKRSGESLAPNYLKELMNDLGFSGNKFTWARGGWGNSPVKRRLDRGISNISWRLAFSQASIAHLSAIKSDHAPILLHTNLEDTFAHKPFRFEAAWIRDDRCAAVVDKA